MGLPQHVPCTPNCATVFAAARYDMIGAEKLLPGIVCISAGRHLSCLRPSRLAASKVNFSRPFFKSGYVKRSGKPDMPCLPAET